MCLKLGVEALRVGVMVKKEERFFGISQLTRAITARTKDESNKNYK